MSLVTWDPALGAEFFPSATCSISVTHQGNSFSVKRWCLGAFPLQIEAVMFAYGCVPSIPSCSLYFWPLSSSPGAPIVPFKCITCNNWRFPSGKRDVISFPLPVCEFPAMVAISTSLWSASNAGARPILRTDCLISVSSNKAGPRGGHCTGTGTWYVQAHELCCATTPVIRETSEVLGSFVLCRKPSCSFSTCRCAGSRRWEGDMGRNDKGERAPFPTAGHLGQEILLPLEDWVLSAASLLCCSQEHQKTGHWQREEGGRTGGLIVQRTWCRSPCESAFQGNQVPETSAEEIFRHGSECTHLFPVSWVSSPNDIFGTSFHFYWKYWTPLQCKVVLLHHRCSLQTQRSPKKIKNENEKKGTTHLELSIRLSVHPSVHPF